MLLLKDIFVSSFSETQKQWPKKKKNRKQKTKQTKIKKTHKKQTQNKTKKTNQSRNKTKKPTGSIVRGMCFLNPKEGKTKAMLGGNQGSSSAGFIVGPFIMGSTY